VSSHGRRMPRRSGTLGDGLVPGSHPACHFLTRDRRNVRSHTACHGKYGSALRRLPRHDGVLGVPGHGRQRHAARVGPVLVLCWLPPLPVLPRGPRASTPRRRRGRPAGRGRVAGDVIGQGAAVRTSASAGRAAPHRARGPGARTTSRGHFGRFCLRSVHGAPSRDR
jgi:hypothetical protein